MVDREKERMESEESADELALRWMKYVLGARNTILEVVVPCSGTSMIVQLWKVFLHFFLLSLPGILHKIVAKVKAEASLLRLTNENLSKQVEGLQLSRLNEVEELAYLNWVNSCLRDELCNSISANSDKASVLSP
ncbi:uncharacterized protein [Euphorbia lathyris]|uniref:uncharacterized protein n=1 Tax=Euphorbia lathyris TaxID=212925 RepID=UPI003313C9D5